jgi:hypothetical protein
MLNSVSFQGAKKTMNEMPSFKIPICKGSPLTFNDIKIFAHKLEENEKETENILVKLLNTLKGLLNEKPAVKSLFNRVK